MKLLMSTTQSISHSLSKWRTFLTAPVLALGLVLTPTPGVWGQQSAAAPGPGQQEQGLKIELLDASTGSGSKSQTQGQANMNNGPQNQAVQPIQGVIPAVPAALPAINPAPMRVLSPEERELLSKYSGLISALEQSHRQTLGNYNINAARLKDPFLPIEEVRQKAPDEPQGGDLPIDPTKPPVERLLLSQLKLVAVVGFSGSSLASFEDAAGTSYILRQGDKIGRNNGKIVRITPNVVTVEEPPRRGVGNATVTEIMLNVLSK